MHCARLAITVALASHHYLRLTLHLPKSVNPVRYWYECCRSGIIVTAVKVAMTHYLHQWRYCHDLHDALSTAVAILSRSPWRTIYSSGDIVTIAMTHYLQQWRYCHDRHKTITTSLYNLATCAHFPFYVITQPLVSPIRYASHSILPHFSCCRSANFSAHATTLSLRTVIDSSHYPSIWNSQYMFQRTSLAFLRTALHYTTHSALSSYGTRCSVPCSQDHAAGSYPEPGASNPSELYYFIHALTFPDGSMKQNCFSCVLHDPTALFSTGRQFGRRKQNSEGFIDRFPLSSADRPAISEWLSREQQYSEENLSQCRCAHRKSHYNWPGNRNPAARSFFSCSAFICILQESVTYLTTIAVAGLQGVECLDG